MRKTMLLCLCLLLGVTSAYAAETKSKDKSKASDDVKVLSGMTIVGNDEAPKALYIVPWKSSEIGMETGLNMLVNKDNNPVDREEFKRKLEYYKVSTSNNTGR